MSTLVSIRTKMGVEIRCDRVSGGFAYSHNGRTVHVTADNVQSDPVAAEAHFFTAWRDVSGFVPFTVLRRLRGRYRGVGVCFMPRNAQPVAIKAGWHSRSVRYAAVQKCDTLTTPRTDDAI
jgi:hypothetical protein